MQSRKLAPLVEQQRPLRIGSKEQLLKQGKHTFDSA